MPYGYGGGQTVQNYNPIFGLFFLQLVGLE